MDSILLHSPVKVKETEDGTVTLSEVNRKAYALTYADRVKIHCNKSDRLLCNISDELYWTLVRKGYIILQLDRYGYAN